MKLLKNFPMFLMGKLPLLFLLLILSFPSIGQNFSLLGDLTPAGSSQPGPITELNGKLIWLVENPNRLVVSDGNTVEVILNISDYIQAFNIRTKVYNNKLYFAYASNLYVTDGTAAGSYKLANVVDDLGQPNYTSIFNLAIYNGDLYFDGGGLFRYNESMTLPQAVSENVPRITHMVGAQGQLYFSATTGSFNINQNYQFGNGTTAGSTPISSDPHIFVDYCRFAPIYEIADHAVYIQTECDALYDHKVFFDEDFAYGTGYSYSPEVLNDDLFFANRNIGADEDFSRLMRFQNGQSQAVFTSNVSTDSKHHVNNLTVVGDILYFTANYKLYKFQNNAVSEVKDFGVSLPFDLIKGDDKLYFLTRDISSFNNFKVWESNGTAAGTLDLYTFSSNIELDLRNYWNGDLYFKSTAQGFGREIWKLDLNPNLSAPVPTLSTTNTNPSGPFTVNVSFNENVNGFTASDIIALGFDISNFSGSGSNYSFTATPLTTGALGISIPEGIANDGQGNANIASNALSILSQIDPATLCNVQVTAGNSSITISNIYAPTPIIQLYDANYNSVYSCSDDDCPFEQVVTGLAPGLYHFTAQLFTNNYGGNICNINEDIIVGGNCVDVDGDGICADQDCDDLNSNLPQPVGTSCNDGNANTTNDVILSDGCTCEGTPIQGGCNVTATSSNNSITITGLTGQENAKLFDGSFGVLFSCNPWSGSSCSGSETITGLVTGVTYFVSAQSTECDEWIPVTVVGGGCTDNDNDGICADQDCDDNNANLPQPAGSSCNDGDANTTNDVILSDGCTCKGTPIDNGSCNVAATSSNGSITITGLTSNENTKIFDSSYSTVFSCNPWNGDPCSGNEIATGLTVGATYFVSVQSTNCDEWIPVTVAGGNGCTDNDNDGVCADQDCDDNNANYPQPVGNSCDDGNSNTTEDVIQADGCTCEGTPINNGCNVAATSSNGGITITGLNSQSNAKVFDGAFAEYWACNPWNGNSCSSTETVTGLQSGVTYYVSVQSNVCNEWIPVTVGGGNSNLPDLNVSAFNFQSSASIGDIVYFNFDLNNAGQATATNDFTINMYLSTNTSLDGSDYKVGELLTGNIAPGTIPNVQGAIFIDSSVPANTYYLLVSSDDSNVISESNEGNNVTASSNTIQVGPSMSSNSLAKNESQEGQIQLNRLFPNPTSHDLFISLEAEKEEGLVLQVIDLNGKVVMEKTITAEIGLTSFMLETSTIQNGLYQLFIQGSQARIVSRFLKQ